MKSIIKYNLIIGIYLLVSTMTFSFNFSVAPTTFNINLNKINTDEIILINNTSEPMRLESSLEIPDNYENYNLNDSIKLHPKIISIKPGGRQIARFRVKPPVNLEAGEYKSYIIFKELPSKFKKNSEIKKGINTEIGIVTEIGISIYGYYGDINKKVIIKDAKFDYDLKSSRLIVVLNTESRGNSSVKLSFNIEILTPNNKILKKEHLNLGRTARIGKKKVESSFFIENLKGNKIKITVLDEDNKELFKTVSKVF